MTADEVNAWLMRHNWSGYRLYQATGIAQSSISDWRAGKNSVPPWLPLILAKLEDDMPKRMQYLAVTITPGRGGQYVASPPADPSSNGVASDMSWLLNSYGRIGWDLVSTERQADASILAFFKQPMPDGMI